MSDGCGVWKLGEGSGRTTAAAVAPDFALLWILLTCSLTLAFASNDRPSPRSVDLFRLANAVVEADAANALVAAEEEEEEEEATADGRVRRRVR